MRKMAVILLVLMVLLSSMACGTQDGNIQSSGSTVSANEADVTTTTTQKEAGADASTSDTQPDRTVDNGVSSTNPSSGSAIASKTSAITAKTTVGSAVTTSMPVDRADYVTVNGSSKNLKTWVYQMNDSGLYVREARFESGKSGEPVTIVAATDIHFTSINDKDRQENNAAMLWTYEKRKNITKNAVANVNRIMAYAAEYDQVVFTGDNMDFVSWGNIEQVQNLIWKKDPNAMVVLGNHDSTRTLHMSGQIEDTSTLESRYDMLKSGWKHDVYYTSKVIKNKVMVIQLDNSQNRFWVDQLPKLKADLDVARKNGYVVLLFYHIPLRTGNKDYRLLKSFYPNSSSANFYTDGVYNQDDSTAEMYQLITNSADVIKGTFCGHEHYNYYMEINAKTPDGKDAPIPQYLVASTGLSDTGVVMKITVR